MRRAVPRASRIIWWVVLLVGLLAAGVVILNRRWLVDFWRGMQYEPSAEMVEIREDLALTERGKFLFNALQPTLNEAEEFNASCHQDASETAVLGCYTEGKVKIYNITTPELAGIREVTTAHEMLHAVWARMNAAEQEGFYEALEQVIAENPETIGEELGTYGEEARLEEAYVRAGTEVAKLPEQLERHFGEYFGDRGRIVEFYDNYIAVFREKKEQAEKLQEELPGLKKEIEAAIREYEAAAAELRGEVGQFNACAEQAGCFAKQAEFLARRAELVAKQRELSVQNEELNAAIAGYNAKIDEYNQVVDDSRKLESEINSNGLTEVEF